MDRSGLLGWLFGEGVLGCLGIMRCSWEERVRGPVGNIRCFMSDLIGVPALSYGGSGPKNTWVGWALEWREVWVLLVLVVLVIFVILVILVILMIGPMEGWSQTSKFYALDLVGEVGWGARFGIPLDFLVFVFG